MSGQFASNQVIDKTLTLIDGSQILVAVADRVFIYDASTKEMVKQTRGSF